MVKVFLMTVLLLGCGAVSDYSDAELLVDSERQIAVSHDMYKLRQTNGGGDIIVSSAKPAASFTTGFQLMLSPATEALPAGQLFSAVIYSPSRSNPTNNMLTIQSNAGVVHGQTMLAQWRTSGNIFAFSARKQRSHMYAGLFFLRAALSHGGMLALGGYAEGTAVHKHKVSIAYSGRKLALAYRDRKAGMDMVVSSELHQGQEFIALDALVVSPNGNIMHYLQSKNSTLNKLNDQYSRLYLPKISCDDGDLVLIRVAGSNHVHESSCHLIK